MRCFDVGCLTSRVGYPNPVCLSTPLPIRHSRDLAAKSNLIRSKDCTTAKLLFHQNATQKLQTTTTTIDSTSTLFPLSHPQFPTNTITMASVHRSPLALLNKTIQANNSISELLNKPRSELTYVQLHSSHPLTRAHTLSIRQPLLTPRLPASTRSPS